jgi:hypothetical protein
MSRRHRRAQNCVVAVVYARMGYHVGNSHGRNRGNQYKCAEKHGITQLALRSAGDKLGTDSARRPEIDEWQQMHISVVEQLQTNNALLQHTWREQPRLSGGMSSENCAVYVIGKLLST